MRLPQDRILHIDIEYIENQAYVTSEWQGELVRCKDCKYGHKQIEHEGELFYQCDYSECEEWFTGNFFCANGERREP